MRIIIKKSNRKWDVTLLDDVTSYSHNRAGKNKVRIVVSLLLDYLKTFYNGEDNLAFKNRFAKLFYKTIEIEEIKKPQKAISTMVKIVALIEERDELKKKITELEAELKSTDYLLTQYKSIYDIIPACSIHGTTCIPHAIEWVEKSKEANRCAPNATDQKKST